MLSVATHVASAKYCDTMSLVLEIRRIDASSGRRAAIRVNATVNGAAANGIDFRTRAARGSVCNGLFAEIIAVDQRPASWY